MKVMIKSKASCSEAPTNATSRWHYHEYYTGDKDKENRRNGDGENHWSGAESLEWFTGRFFLDTMHGEGEYRWRYRGPEHAFITYEGQFYGNSMHGYGVMSYPDGRIFNGIFYKNMRWGPGVETHASVLEDVGLWRGTRLIRLAWRSPVPHVTLDLNIGPTAQACVEPFRNLLTTRVKTLGKVNSAIELLKQSGADPILASEKWHKLYSKHCNDLDSQACHVDAFDNEYYKSHVHLLEEVAVKPQLRESTTRSSFDSLTNKTFYAWNNNKIIKEMMKHCYKHEYQREAANLELRNIITGPRNFKRPAGHELNSRSLLMASFLGYITNVVQLVNESNVHPDVSDAQGNTALMYATSGDQAEVIHFLSEAGANVNSYNDSCCTPLALALVRYACAVKDIPISGIVQALIPPPVVPVPPPIDVEGKPMEWLISRDSNPATTSPTAGALMKSLSKTTAAKSTALKKPKSNLELPKFEVAEDETDTSFIEEKQIFKIISADFTSKASELFSLPNATISYYLFEVQDMVKEIDAYQDEQNKPTQKEKNPKKIASKVIKEPTKPSKDVLWQGSDRDVSSLNSEDRMKKNALNRIIATIEQLLNDGADPRLVRCPQPALLIATISGSADVVRQLVEHGADVNEEFPQIFSYTALDLAVSLPLSYEHLDLIRTLLECGASTDHTLKYEGVNSDISMAETPGPTLLHAALVKHTDSEVEEEIRCQVLELLLQYGCDALKEFNGSSALDKSMNNASLFDVIIRSPKTDLNAPINNFNHSVLFKLFYNPFCNSIPITERLQELTNLLLFGADPFIECQHQEEIFANIFVFAKKTLDGFEKSPSPSSKADPKAKKDQKDTKSKKDFKPMSTKSVGKMAVDDIGDYRQAIDLVTECARMLHIRWLQGKLLKELIKVVEKYEHRQWNMIFPEHKNKKAVGLWLSCSRSLEIWDILQTKRKKNFKDRRILKHLLCIVEFYSQRVKTSLKSPVKADEKDMIENIVNCVLREHNTAKNMMGTEHIKLSRPYVMPELYEGSEQKFQVCFECSLPLGEEKIQCSLCKMISFCSLECIRVNIDNIGSHPCSDYLRMKYFTDSEDSIVLNKNMIPL